MREAHTRRWRVGQLADATGLTVRTLHYWDELGLIVPSARTVAGHRLYGAEDVRRVYEVVALRELGLSLEAIAGVLDGGGPGLAEVLASWANDPMEAEAEIIGRLIARHLIHAPGAGLAAHLEER